MDENQKKELFSKAFVKALAAQAGLRSSEPDVDDDSVDVIVRGRGYRALIRNPQIDVQLKCTSIDEGGEEYLKFALPLKNYNELRGADIICPRYLFVLVVPERCGDWLVQEATFSVLRHCCYWVSLRDKPDVPNKSKVTVNIPRTQRLTSESILYLMQMASSEEAA